MGIIRNDSKSWRVPVEWNNNGSGFCDAKGSACPIQYSRGPCTCQCFLRQPSIHHNFTSANPPQMARSTGPGHALTQQ